MTTAGSWTKKAPLTHVRSHPATAVWGGRIYVFGGGGPGFQSLNSVEIYDPRTETWAHGQEMPTRRSGAVALTLNDRVYVIGGGFKKPDGKFMFLPTVEMFVPMTGAWEKGPDMVHPHDYPAGAVVHGAIYILGGHHPDATEGGPQTDPGFNICERFSPQKREWVETAPLPTPRFALAAAVIEERLWALGGVACTGTGLTEFAVVEVYDPHKEKWTVDDALSLPWPAAGHSACVHKGRLYIFGGYSRDGVHNRAACYDPLSRRWQEIPPLIEPCVASAAASLNDMIYVVGGWAADGRTPLDTVAAYVPSQ